MARRISSVLVVLSLSLAFVIACGSEESGGGASSQDAHTEVGADSLFDSMSDATGDDADTSGLACDPADESCEIPCQLLPAMYKDWVGSHMGCEEDADCAMVGGTGACDCMFTIWKGGGDPVSDGAKDTALAYLARLEDSACDAFRETLPKECDTAPSSNLRCASGTCTADLENCMAQMDQAETVGETTTPEVDLTEGTLDCKEFHRQCVAACPLNAENLPEPSCFEACKPYLTPQGEADLDAFLGCLDQAGCGAMEGQEALLCMGDSCFAEYTGCFQGDQSCGDVLGCMGDCPEGDGGACVVLCTQDGTPDAQQKLFDIIGCISDSCCPDDYATCGTPEGQTCSETAVGLGGDCFTVVTACMMGD